MSSEWLKWKMWVEAGLANQQEHQYPPENMANRCPLCMEKWPTETAVHAHLVCDHKRTGEDATKLIEQYCHVG